MILDAYESPSHRLSHAVPLVSIFEVPLVWRKCRSQKKLQLVFTTKNQYTELGSWSSRHVDHAACLSMPRIWL